MKKAVKNYLIKPHNIRVLFLSLLVGFSSVGIFIFAQLQAYQEILVIDQSLRQELLPFSTLTMLLMALILGTTLALGILFLLMSAAVHKEAFVKGHEHALMCKLVEVKK